VTLPGLAFKNLSRNKFRVVLTIVGVAVAIMAFVLLRTVVSAWTSGGDWAAKDRVVTRHKVTFVMTLPLRYYEDVKQVPHVKAATFATWFGGKDPNHDKEFFSTLAVESKTYFDVYGEMAVPPEQLDAWQQDRKGAIVGDVLAKKLGWKVGDRVMIQSGIYQGDWQFDVVGIYTAKAKSVDRSTFIFHWKYLNETLPERAKDQVGWIVSRVDGSSHAADVGVAIDKVFDEKDTQTLSQDERSFNTSFLAAFSAILTVINVVSVVLLVIMMLILGNTIAMGVRERTNEYAVLRAIGFLPKHVAQFIIFEALIMGVLGGALGLALAYPLVNEGFGRWLEENMGSFFPYFKVDPTTAAEAFVLAVGLAGAAAAIPSRQASRLKVVDALRRVA
jgi:putative ABC transport system permease protein